MYALGNTYHIYTVHINPIVKHYSASNAVMQSKNTMVDFYPGLPHIQQVSLFDSMYVVYKKEMGGWGAYYHNIQ